MKEEEKKSVEVTYSYTLDYISYTCPQCGHFVELDNEALICSECGYEVEEDVSVSDTCVETQTYDCIVEVED